MRQKKGERMNAQAETRVKRKKALNYTRCKAQLALTASHLPLTLLRKSERGLQRLTVEGLWELLTRHQPGREEAEVVGTVAQVAGNGPVHSQRGRLGGKPPRQLDYMGLV